MDLSVGGRTGSDATRFDVGDIGLGVLRNFNREYGSTPAYSVRADVFLPRG